MLPALSSTNTLRTTAKDGYDYSKQIKNACQKNRKEHQLLTKQLKGIKQITDDNISMTNFTIRKLTLTKSISSPPGLSATANYKASSKRDSLSVPAYQRHRSSTFQNGNGLQTATSWSSNITLENKQHSRNETAVKYRSLSTNSQLKPNTSYRNRLSLHEGIQEQRSRSTSLPPLKQTASNKRI